jgi:hypothetical protein
VSSDLDRALAEQQEAEAMIRASDQPEHKVNENGYVQPLHDWLQWSFDNALEAELIRKEYAMARAAGKAL